MVRHKPMYPTAIRLFREDTGSETIEFAVSAVVLLTIIFGILDMSRALYADHFVSNAAREATRYAMVRGASWKNTTCTTSATFSCTATATDVTSYVKTITPLGFTANNLAVTTTWPGTTPSGADCSSSNVNNSPDCVVTVKVVYNFNFVLPFLPKGALQLASTSSMAISQ